MKLLAWIFEADLIAAGRLALAVPLLCLGILLVFPGVWLCLLAHKVGPQMTFDAERANKEGDKT